MVRVKDVDDSLDFYCNKLGLVELRRIDNERGRFSLVFLAAPGDEEAQIELTYNWDPEDYGEGRNFGHVAYQVDDIYATCRKLMDAGITINRPPRDGRMAFVRSPDNISIELLQHGDALAAHHATEHGAPQKTQVMCIFRVFADDLFAQGQQIRWSVHLNDAWNVVAQPVVETLLRALNNRLNRPQCVVQVQGNRTNAVHVLLAPLQLPAIVVSLVERLQPGNTCEIPAYDGARQRRG